MDAESQRKLQGCILTIWNDARKQNLAAPFERMSPVHEVFRDRGAYRLGFNGIKGMKDALEILADSELSKNYSQKYLNSQIEEIVLDLLAANPQQIQQHTESKIQTWLSQLESRSVTEWTVIAPIANLVLRVDLLEVGNVTFLKHDNSETVRIIDQIDMINQGTASPPDVRHFMTNLTNRRLKNRVIAKLKIKAIDSNAAVEMGRIEIEHALNVLRLFGFGVMKNDPLSYKMLMGIDGTVFAGQPIIATLTSAKANMNFESTGALYSYVFSQEEVAKMDQLSFQYVNSMLKKEKKNDFEKLLETSIDFFGKGMNDQDLIDSFLDFIISLESLLLKEREPSKGLLAERVALIVGQNLQQRLDAFDFIEYLYQLRSNIVHQGFVAVTLDDVKKIAYFAFIVIITLFSHALKIEKIDDLVDMCDKMKFNGPAFGH